MDVRIADNSDDISSCRYVSSHSQPIGLPDTSSIMGLSDVAASDSSDVAASAKDQEARARQLLEQLFSLTSIEAPQKQVCRLLNDFGSCAGLFAAETLPTKFGPKLQKLFGLLRPIFEEVLRGKIDGRPLVSTSQELFDFLRYRIGQQDVEVLLALFLSSENRLLADRILSRGTVNELVAFPREILKHAIKANATALILVHNHPSGNPQPSDADIRVTQDIKAVCDVAGISLHDHLIVTDSAIFSFHREGIF